MLSLPVVPPVHSIAAEIASIYNLNLDKIKRKLIEVLVVSYSQTISLWIFKTGRMSA